MKIYNAFFPYSHTAAFLPGGHAIDQDSAEIPVFLGFKPRAEAQLGGSVAKSYRRRDELTQLFRQLFADNLLRRSCL